MQSRTIRVLVVHDDPRIRRNLALSLVLAESLDVELIGVAATGEQAIELLEQVHPHPDVIFLGLLLPGMGGVQAVREILVVAPAAKILVVTTFTEGDRLQEALHAGATGYVLTDLAMDRPLDVIRRVVRGVASSGDGGATAWPDDHNRPTLGDALTEREREVLGLVVQGLSYAAIAERLGMTPTMVKFHLRNIRSKLGTSRLS